MCVQLNKKTAEMVEKVAIDLGLTTDEMVNLIIEWYFEDCEKENNI